MKIIINWIEAIYSDKFLGKIDFFKNLKKSLVRFGIIGLLLALSMGLIFLAGIIALSWLILQNI